MSIEDQPTRELRPKRKFDWKPWAISLGVVFLIAFTAIAFRDAHYAISTAQVENSLENPSMWNINSPHPGTFEAHCDQHSEDAYLAFFNCRLEFRGGEKWVVPVRVSRLGDEDEWLWQMERMWGDSWMKSEQFRGEIIPD